MLKRAIVLSLVIVLLFASSTLALDSVTGNEWQEFSEEEKERYIEGFIDGMNFGMIFLIAEMQQGVDIDLLAEQYRRQGELIIGEEAEQLKQEIIYNMNEDLEGDQTMFNLMVEYQLEL